MSTEKQFTALAEYYDMLNGADYAAYADYVDKMIKEYGQTDNRLVLDLGCGTGSLTFELAKRGYDMIGADISSEMLNTAMDRAYDMGFTEDKSILFLLQDMRSFELYGTVGAVVCAVDGINYLGSYDDMVRCFRLVDNYLDQGGVFIFDVNTPWKFRNVFNGHDFFTEDGDGNVYMGWRNQWREEQAACDFLLTLFIRNSDGSYTRREEEQTEYMWTINQLRKAIRQARLQLLVIHTDLNGTPSSENVGEDTEYADKRPDSEEKWYFVCRREESHRLG
ncbi:MAG: class I SAM-dependent methyltransferase [Clostridia bacterium]|nr:class I SAM-dependent methyltransferase [Clostridia bacterium]